MPAKYELDAAILTAHPRASLWRVVSKFNKNAIALFDRHYSRQTPGGEVGPPGRKLVLLTPNNDALWCTHYPNPKLAMDHLDSYRCVVFRNESSYRSSLLIRMAVEVTEIVWGLSPVDGWVTWVDQTKIRSVNPGFCFKQAGWWLDRDWTHRQRRLVRLRYP